MRLAKEGEEAHIEIDGKRYRIQRKDNAKKIAKVAGLKGVKLLISYEAIAHLVGKALEEERRLGI